MNRPLSFLLGACLMMCGWVGMASATEAKTVLDAKIDPGLPALLGETPRPVWVFFSDKGRHEARGSLAAAEARLSPRALARRAKVRSLDARVLWEDLPLEAEYLAALRDLGLAIRAESRWLNAVSVPAGPAELNLLMAQPFVRRVTAVRRSVPRELNLAPVRSESFAPVPGSPYDTAGRYLGEGGALALPLDYGGSLSELSQHNVPPVHDLGYSGAGVLVGMLDTGFNTTHEALSGLDILGVWDFINDDPVVENEEGDAEGQQNHGSMTFSCLGGYQPGQLIGPAYGASFYLAKTEDTTQEEPIEEDYWVEGIEWLESLGCDIVSSSLAYYGWYEQDDMDGDTAVTTIAADHAVSLGVLVVNSAGNYRNGGWGTIAAPADGDSVMALGALEETGEIASFSSPGPSADGRIKPDLSARGVSNHVVDPGTISDYRTASGTSFSCPLTAGVCALLLEARPDATPMMILECLKATASQADAPDNDYGWGAIDALAALGHLLATSAPETAPSFALDGNWPNPFNPSTQIAFRLAGETFVKLDVIDVQGRLVTRLVDGVLPAGPHSLNWNGRDAAGRPQASGLYFARLSDGAREERSKMLLLK